MKRRPVNPDTIAVTGVIIGLLSFLPGWLTLKQTRISSGTSYSIWQSTGWVVPAIILIIWLICLTLALYPLKTNKNIFFALCGNLILLINFVFAGPAAGTLLQGQASSARVSLGSGFWISLAAVYVVIFASRRLFTRGLGKNLSSWIGFVIVMALLFTGWFNSIAIVVEFNSNKSRFIQELLHHMYLVGVSVVIGALLGVLLGIWATRNKYAEKPIFFLANIAQTIPSMALFGLLIAPLSALSFAYPFLRDIGVRGVGDTPAIIALVIYSILPVSRNTYVGLRQVDRAVIDAGTGMGMSGSQIFRRIEVPLSAPVVLEGVRIAAVQSVGLAAVAALIGAGGLGFFVFQGLGQTANDLILLGAIPIIVIALIVDGLMRDNCQFGDSCGAAGRQRLIQLEDVTKKFGQTAAVSGLYIKVDKGEVCVLIGPSGCGKTTTLRMINRLIEPTYGKIFIDGKDTETVKPEKLRRTIGYAIQSVGLFPHMTVAENIAAVPELLHWPKKRTAERVTELLDLVGLTPIDYEDKYPIELSGGEAQRIGVARALAADPPILLMDEPFGAVDPLTRQRLQRQFLHIQQTLKKTVVLVTHDLDEAIRLADRIAIMQAGKLQQYDTPEVILTRPANKFVHDFVGTDRALKRLSRIPVSGFIKPAPSVRMDSPISEVNDICERCRWVWVVDVNNRLLGWIDKAGLSVANSVFDAMVGGVSEDIAVTGNDTLVHALSRMLGQGFKYIPAVDEEGRLIGQVSLMEIETATAETEKD